MSRRLNESDGRMKPSSGILRITIGAFVLGFGVISYIKFAETFERPDAKVLIGSTGIEVTWPMFLLFLAVAGALGLLMIVLGVLSFRSKED